MSGSLIVMLLVVVGINLISNAQKQKQREQKQREQKQQEQKRRSAAGTQQAEAEARPVRRAPRRPIDDIFPELSNIERTKPRDDRFPDLPPKTAKGGGSAKTSPQKRAFSDTEGSALGGSLEGTAMERAALYSELQADVGKTPAHIVKPLTESSHRHMESSLEGVQAECAPEAELAPAAPLAPDASQAYVIPAARGISGRMFAFDRASVTQGFLYGEILGKPKALRH